MKLFSQGKEAVIIGEDLQNKYQKTLRLVGLCSEKYYLNFRGDSSSIKNNQYFFTISGFTDDIPRPFYFLLETEKHKVYKTSEIFYISQGTQKINFNSEDGKITGSEKNILYKDIDRFKVDMESYSSQKKHLYQIEGDIYKRKNFKVEQKTKDSLQKLYAELDSYEENLLLNLSRKTPASYVLFWKLVQKFEANGFKQNYFQAFNNLDSSVRTSSVGVIFSEELKKGSKIAEGNLFPELILKGKKVQSSLGKSYTIIDFWFSHCGPCIEQMPKYREIYSKYKDKGFEIINISTDRTKDIAKWKKIIKEKQLNWVHYLDENGEKSRYYNINTFPTNFLLDSSGKIIKKDISLEDLDVFLNNGLK
ncbi:TlpA family protein disulfide reductase [Chryseobacterium soli]|uniref:peroxiredoxin family protein n=1 Tax=Chryseobacterium soli TaxID=445961 RepID=UPI0029556B5A|nr:TlpA disulfide reductase family protein [Chryseobacterium soli]MDV7698212.1 TlpA family protein disulfide reductase [Chryseobacterium soli]